MEDSTLYSSYIFSFPNYDVAHSKISLYRCGNIGDIMGMDSIYSLAGALSTWLTYWALMNDNDDVDFFLNQIFSSRDLNSDSVFSATIIQEEDVGLLQSITNITCHICPRTIDVFYDCNIEKPNIGIKYLININNSTESVFIVDKWFKYGYSIFKSRVRSIHAMHAIAGMYIYLRYNSSSLLSAAVQFVAESIAALHHRGVLNHKNAYFVASQVAAEALMRYNYARLSGNFSYE